MKQPDFIEPRKTYKPDITVIECPFCGVMVDESDEECSNCGAVRDFYPEDE